MLENGFIPHPLIVPSPAHFKSASGPTFTDTATCNKVNCQVDSQV